MPPKVDVVGIGSCAVDFFAIVPRLLGSEEKINATRMEIHAGGVTANMLTQGPKDESLSKLFQVFGTAVRANVRFVIVFRYWKKTKFLR